MSRLITPPVGEPEQSPRMLRTEHKTLAADVPRLPFCTFKHHGMYRVPLFLHRVPDSTATWTVGFALMEN